MLDMPGLSNRRTITNPKAKTMKKILFILCLFLSGCCTQKHCVGFDSTNVFFVAKSLQKNDVWEMNSNHGEHLFYRIQTEAITPPETYSSCDECACTCVEDLYYKQYFIGIDSLNNQNKVAKIGYHLQSDDELLQDIQGTFFFENERISFSYNIKNEIITTPAIIHDSIVINTTTYYDVMELHGKKYTTIYLTKDNGFVQAISADTVWTK